MNYRMLALAAGLVMVCSAGQGAARAAAPEEKPLAIENPCTWPDVRCRSESLRDGGSVTMTSADPAIVKEIQAHAVMMARGGQCAGQAAGGQMMTGCPSAWPHVATRTEKLTTGAKVTWTSTDPGQVSKIREQVKLMAGMKHVVRQNPPKQIKARTQKTK